MKPARILIVDDHEVCRRGVRSLLDEEYIEICGEAGNGKEAVDKVVTLHPDMVILDLTMPVMNGMEAASEIRRIRPGTKIVVLTAHGSPVMRGAVKLAGVDAFLLKSAPVQQLLRTIRELLGLQAPAPKPAARRREKSASTT